MRRSARGTGEEGSTLIIALFFVFIFSIFVASVISFTEVGLRASAGFENQRQFGYAADGAVHAAINRFRAGGPCDAYTAPLGPDGQPLADRGMIVRCADDDRPASGRATKPVNALLSLGSEGITTTTEQRILGSIFSNSTVAAGATLVVQGQVSAVGDCTGPIQTTPDPAAIRCANVGGGGADASEGRDPDYAKAFTTVPVRRSVPPCPAGWLVTLEPGYYDDPVSLTAFTASTGACPGKVVWMKPGFYYLDFTFRGGAGAGTWTIDDPNVVVVAGTPRGWTADPSGPRPTLTVPGTCKTEADPDPVDGVQLVAGGGSHIQITRGQVELCAEPSSTDQSISLYGMGPERPSHNLEPTSWNGVSGFQDPGDATTIGETPVAAATADLSSATTDAASITVNSFRPGVPEGALVDAATLRVVHREDGDMDDASSSVKVAAAFQGSLCTGAQAVAVPVRQGMMVEDRVDLVAACGLSAPDDFADLAVTFTATLANAGTSATETLDGIAVEVVYRSPTTTRPTVVTASAGFAGASAALEIGEQPVPLTADAVLNAAGPTSASITLAGLGDPPIPPGSTIDSAVLRVAHRDQGEMAPARVTVPFQGGTCTGLPLAIEAAAIADTRVDLKSCGLNDAGQLLGLTATYSVSLAVGGTTATANLDGLWLELVYRPPPATRAAASVTPGPTAGAFTNPDQAKVIGEVPSPLTADADLDAGTPTASLSFVGYDQVAPVPVGSFIDSAVLRVAHHDVGAMDTPALAVQFAGNLCPSPVLTARPAGIGEDRIDLRACGLTDPGGLAGLTVTYTASLAVGGTSATAKVDGVVLDLAYRPASTRQAATAAASGFADPDHAKVIGEEPTPLTSDVTLASGATAATVTLDGFDSAVPVAPGAVIDSAVLRVAHQEDGWMGSVTVQAAFPGGSGACPVEALAASPGTLATARSADLVSACGLTRAEQLAGLAATFTANPPPTTATATQVPSGTNAVSGFANPDSGRAVDGVTADAGLDTGTGATSASITLSGYAQAAPPPGSTIGSALLRVRHQEDAGVAPVTVSFSGLTCGPVNFAPRAVLGDDTVDVGACGLTDPAQLGGLAVTFAASLDAGATTASARLDGAVLELTYQPPAGTTRLDGIELDLVFRRPAFRPLDGCLTAAPYPSTGCALLLVAPLPGDTATRFASQGTIYAPSAALDVSMAGLSSQVLTRGLVARTIRLGLAAVSGYRRPLVGVPPEPVRFSAYPDVTARAATATATGFTNAGRATAIDGDGADALLVGPSASLTLADWAPDAPLSAPVVEAAILRIVHREDPEVAGVSVTVDGLAGGPCANPFTLPRYPSTGQWGEDQIDLTPCGLTEASQLAGLTVTYTATRGAVDATAHLDGITLDLLAGPVLRARVAFDATRDSVSVVGWSVLR